MEKFQHKIQVTESQFQAYNPRLVSADVAANLRHQLNDVLFLVDRFGITRPKILIIGVGDNYLGTLLKHKYGYSVKTLDIDERFNPDHLGSVSDLNEVAKERFDIIVCAHVLEHLPYKYFSGALQQLRASGSYVLIYLPMANLQFRVMAGILPLMKKNIRLTMPLLFKAHKFDGQHYWELGTRGFTVKKVSAEIGKYFDIIKNHHSSDWTYSYNFILSSKNTKTSVKQAQNAEK